MNATYSRSQETGTFISELPEEPQVVLPELAQVGQPVAEHGDPLEAEAEREARDLLGVVADEAVELGSTMPAPPISIQPENLQTRQPSPSQRKHDTSGSIEGSVNGK